MGLRRLKAPATAGWLHVMGRTDPRRDGARAIACLAAACGRLPVDLHAYCVLPGHFHLLLRGGLPAAREMALSVAEPSGPAIRVVGVAFGRHLMEVSRYVHLNPVEAALADQPDDWPFSSFRFYLGEPVAPSWLVTEAVLGRFGTIGARHRYRAFIEAGLDRGTRDVNGRPLWDALFAAGSDAENTAWRIEPVLARRGGPRADGADWAGRIAERRVAPPPAALARTVARRFGVPVAALRSSRTGGPQAALARGALVHEARAGGGLALASLAAWIGYRSPSGAVAAAERFRRAARADSPVSPRGPVAPS
jgi:hypothetical protein